MKVTRRKLAAALLAPAAAAQAQTPSVPRDEVEAARARLKTNAEAMAKVDLPMSTEPAFRFEA
jgi:hypothetical protein